MIRFRKRVNDLNWKYAIGEISLIFVGITLAIWFNNWNQNKIDGRKKDQYLRDLKDDLLDDIGEFAYLIGANDKRIRRISLLNELVDKPDLDSKIHCDSVQKYLASASFINVFIGSSSVFKDLENTGNLILLDNSSLKRKVMKYYAKVDSRKQYEDLNSRFHINTIGAFLKEHWNTGALFRLGINHKTQDEKLGIEDCRRTKLKIGEFRRDPKLEQELINHINFSNFIVTGNNEEYEVMKKEAEGLIVLIENEL